MRSALSFAAVSLVLLSACGSDVAVDDGSGGSGDAAATSSVVTTIAVTTAVGSSGSGDASSDSSSSSTGEGGTGSGEGGSVSTAQGGSGEGGSASSAQGGSGSGEGGASTGSGTEPFVCGEVECAADEQCCGSQGGFQCVGANDPCQGVTLTCQSAANCEGGQICCLQGDFQDAEAVCADQCESGPAGPIQLCETEDECPPGIPCQEAFGGFKICTDGLGFP